MSSQDVCFGRREVAVELAFLLADEEGELVGGVVLWLAGRPPVGDDAFAAIEAEEKVIAGGGEFAAREAGEELQQRQGHQGAAEEADEDVHGDDGGRVPEGLERVGATLVDGGAGVIDLAPGGRLVAGVCL